MSKIFLKKNEIIRCPDCNKYLYNVKRNIYQGELKDASAFEPHSSDVPQPQNGDFMQCPFCNGIFYTGRSIYTARGWLM